MTNSVFGGLPKIKKLKDQETISVSVTYSEPAIRKYDYTFSSKLVSIKENGKSLGKLALTDEDVEKIDIHLDMIRRGKKASRIHMGAPIYSISYMKDGHKVGTWSFYIYEAKESKKALLSLFALRQRLGKKMVKTVEQAE